ncbi:LysR family transcriptional regulator [Burkholderia plantarii]|uniref:LysR family transcriptional regulator n=1 Tax=Burkholderia plantarii TaxID=41899 RepID=UPI00272D82D8|nr:LysR family transcriptional regulator [Burkholderia plantarii]WLE61274.1 LysR family transcriptional regulator [Burkholderia plantarii]
MLDLRRLRYFVTVADELHFGRAALRLRIAQPPLTRHIAALESELGIRLFERSTRAVRLTREGALFLERARAVVEAASEAEAAARKLAQGMIGRIVIGYASSIPMSDAFSNLVRDAGDAMPEIELVFREVPTTHQRQQIADGTLDFAFGWAMATGRGGPADPADEPIRSRVVSREPLVAAVPAHGTHARQDALAFETLADETFVTFVAEYGSALNAALDTLAERAGFTPRGGPTASQITTLVSLVAAGRGIAIVPSFAAALRRPGVAYVPLAAPHVIEQTVTWREPCASGCVARFVELVKAVEPERVDSPAAGTATKRSARRVSR